MAGNEGQGEGSVRLASAAGRWVLAVAVLGDSMILLEATVVNVALPTIGRNLGAGVAGLQWTLNSYVLTLAALVLVGGSLSDICGRRRIFILGAVVFVAASALCAAAPTIGLLILARFIQGIGGALLTPGSLAIIEAVFHPADRTRAIGAWAGLGAVAGAIGPTVGGYLTDAVSWRAVFLINIPLGVFVVAAALRHVPETRDPTHVGGIDLRGAALATLAIAGVCFALIDASGGLTPMVIAASVVGVGAAALPGGRHPARHVPEFPAQFHPADPGALIGVTAIRDGNIRLRGTGQEPEGTRNMKVAVMGGTGLIGSQVVKILNASGHEAVPHARSTGVDLLSGRGLPGALKGADVVVDVTNSPTFDDASLAFFQTTTDNLVAAAGEAGVGHAVLLSIVGADLVPGLVYYRGKVLQEDVLKSGSTPYSIVRATQFFEFIEPALAFSADESTVRVSATLIQPIAAADVAQAVADMSAGRPLRGTRDVAGPEVFSLDELGRITLAARDDHRTVITDNSAGIFAAVSGDALIAKDGAVIATTTYREWLAR